MAKHRKPRAGVITIAKRGEVNWPSILQKAFRDIFLLGFGAWVIWKQVYALSPNGYLAAIGFGMMVPSAGTAIIKILSEPGSFSSSSPSQEELPPPKSSGGTGD
jgi:hypothetical protein